MIEIKAKLRKWGNSFGVVIPQKALEGTGKKEGDDVKLIINSKKVDLTKFLGRHKFSQSTEEMLKEIDEELYDDW